MFTAGGVYRDTAEDEVITTDFVGEWRTLNDGDAITLPLRNGFNYNFVVDWGDGATDTITAWDQVQREHVYATAGIYTVTMTGLCETLYFNLDPILRDEIVSVINMGVMGWTTFENTFHGCRQMTSFTLGTTDTSAVTDMSNMFNGCWRWTSAPDLSAMDTSACTTMQSMFLQCSSISSPPDVSTWNTSNVTNMSDMFSFCEHFESPPIVSGWDVSNVTEMTAMFGRCERMHTAPATAGWDTSSVTSMAFMFNRDLVITNMQVDTWDITGVTWMQDMFDGTALTTAQYDQLLIAWAAQAVQPNLNFSGGNSTYTAGGAAETAHNTLTNAPNNWIITDLGSV